MRRVLLFALPTVLLAACGPDLSDLRPVLDLAAELPVAEVHREVAEIDFGAPGADSHLLHGWSWNERAPAPDGGETTFTWGLGEGSSLRFFLVAPRELRLALRVMPFPEPEETPQEVTVQVNGHPVERLVLDPARQPGWAVHEVPVPREALAAGWNTAAFHYRRSVTPRELGLSGDTRPLAVAWDRLRIEPAAASNEGPEAPSRAPSEAGSEGALRLPLGSAAAYHAPIPPGSRLALDGLRSSGAGGRLVVELRREGGVPVELASFGPSGRRRSVELPEAGGGRLARLTLRAVPEAWGTGEGELEVEAPRVLTPDRAPDRAAGTGGAEGTTASRPEGGAAGARLPDGPRPDVLVYLVDTLRRDRVGVYGTSPREGLTPRIDAFAREAVVFEDALTQAPWTRPAVASLLTGLPPLAHGVTGIESRLAETAVTLPELLREAGYETAAWSTNWHVVEATCLAQGFDDFHLLPEAPAEVVHRGVLDWLDRRLEAPSREKRRKPLFLYVHVLDPHAPYRPPPDLRRRFAPGVEDPEAGTREYLKRVYGASGAERARLLAALPPLYDAETAYADRAFGELLDGLAARGLREGSLIVLLSDHGEEFDEHGDLGHGNNLYGESLRIPLVIRVPGRPPAGGVTRRRGPALPMDVPATVLARLGLPRPSAMAGIDLLAPGAPPAERPAFAHLDYEGRAGVSVVLGEWKLIEPLRGRPRGLGRFPELYHLARDPGERRDLAADRPVRAGYLRQLVRRHLRAAAGGAGGGETMELDPEVRRGLEALGYL